MTIMWTAISSVATVVLVAFTIWLFFYKKRKKVFVELATAGRSSEEPKIYIIVKNDCESLITIVRILVKENGKDLIELSSQDFDLPKLIHLHENIQLDSPYIAHNIHKIKEIYAEDSAGRRWPINKKSFEQASKILRNYIGKRITWPSMGDELDENKIK